MKISQGKKRRKSESDKVWDITKSILSIQDDCYHSDSIKELIINTYICIYDWLLIINTYIYKSELSLHGVFLFKESSLEETPEEESSDGDKEEVNGFTAFYNNLCITHCFSVGLKAEFWREVARN